MKMKMLLMQFVSIVNLIQMKLRENNADQKKASVPSMKLISESKPEQSDPRRLLKTVPSDESNSLNHHPQSVDAHKHGVFQL
jgi:hypothetical protein